LKVKTTIKLLLIIFLYSFFMIACSDKEENNELISKKQKEYSYFYPDKNSSVDLQKKETLYIPVYSHVYTSNDKYERMGITLSIRNTDSLQKMLIQHISYYSTTGDLIEVFIDTAHILKPMASIDFIVDLRDMRGGSGANFIIEWAGSENLSTPIIQAVMVNNSGNRAFSFITNGYTIKTDDTQ